jgi:hypothetical protein
VFDLAPSKTRGGKARCRPVVASRSLNARAQGNGNLGVYFNDFSFITYFQQLSYMSSTINGASSDLGKVTLKALDGTIISGSDLWENGPVLVVCLRRPGCREFFVNVKCIVSVGG